MLMLARYRMKRDDKTGVSTCCGDVMSPWWSGAVMAAVLVIVSVASLPVTAAAGDASARLQQTNGNGNSSYQ